MRTAEKILEGKDYSTHSMTDIKTYFKSFNNQNIVIYIGKEISYNKDEFNKQKVG